MASGTRFFDNRSFLEVGSIENASESLGTPMLLSKSCVRGIPVDHVATEAPTGESLPSPPLEVTDNPAQWPIADARCETSSGNPRS